MHNELVFATACVRKSDLCDDLTWYMKTRKSSKRGKYINFRGCKNTIVIKVVPVCLCQILCHRSLISDVTCNYVSADGGRDGLWWLALLGHWLSYTVCWQSLLVLYWLMFGMLFIFLTTSLGCFVHGLCFSNNGLNKLPWTSYLHAILRIICRGDSGLTTDSPCGVWFRGWTTCLLHDNPLFGPHLKMRVGM